MPTLKQKKVAKKLVESLSHAKPPTGGEIVESSGYGPSMKKNPQVVLNSDGVKEELITVYGFNTEKAKEVVAEILIGGENDTVKLKAADMIFKVNSDYAPEKHLNVNVDATPNPEAIEAAEQAYLQHLDEPSQPTQSA